MKILTQYPRTTGEIVEVRLTPIAPTRGLVEEFVNGIRARKEIVKGRTAKDWNEKARTLAGVWSWGDGRKVR